MLQKICKYHLLVRFQDYCSYCTDIGTFMGYVIGAQAKFDAKKPERQQGEYFLFHSSKC